MKYILPITTLIILISFNGLHAQNQPMNYGYLHDETPDDPYMPQDPAKMKKAAAYTFQGSFYTTTQVNVDENGLDIQNDAANEPSIAVHPTNRDMIIIGWRQFDNIVSNFRQAGNGYTYDGGQTWTVPEPLAVGEFRSDPVLDSDSEGNFFYNSLTKTSSGTYYCVIHRAESGSHDFNEGTYAHGGDKQWMAIDKTDGIGQGNIYEYWNSSYSSCPPGSYTRSTDGGNTYDDCDGILGDPIWGTLTVGREGQLYTVGMRGSSIVVTKSSNAYDPDQQTVWDFMSIVDLDGEMQGFVPINQVGLLGQAWIATDNSYGPGKDNVYVLSSVKRNNTGDNADVMFARSTDMGVTWHDPIRVNDDIDLNYGNWQWFGTMSVAPNGRIDAIWLDTRNAPSTNEYISELYYSNSIDQGETWSINEKISEQFNPQIGYPNQEKLGDYFDMISDNDMVHVAWAATFTGGQDVYYTRIDPNLVGVSENKDNMANFSSYPNPISERVTFRYTLNKPGNVQISIFDITGQKITDVCNEYQQSGTHNLAFKLNDIPSGIYYAVITAEKHTNTIKISCVK